MPQAIKCSDIGQGIAIGPEHALYGTGGTSSANLPVTPGAFQETLWRETDVFATKAGFLFYQKASLVINKLSDEL